MPFAAGKTFTLSELIQAVDDIIANPAAKNDPALKDKLDWLFAHFDPDPDQKQLLMSYPQYLRAALQQTLNTRNLLALSDIKLSAPHEAYLRLHAARLGLNDNQTNWLIDQQKQAAAAKAIDDLAAQGATTPDKTQILNQIQNRINWDNGHTYSLQRAVTTADAHISRQLQQVLRPVIAQNPSIPRAQVAQAAYELAQTAYQTLKPQLPTIGSPQNLAAVVKQEILTPDRISHIPTLQAFNFTPDQFSAAIDAASPTLFHRHLKAARTDLGLLQAYGQETEHLVTATTPPPEIRPKGTPGFHDLRTAYGYPGETLINAADPDAAENTIINLPKALVKAVTYPIRAWVIGNIQTSFVSLAITHQQQQVKMWAIQRSFSFLPSTLQDRWHILFQQKNYYQSPNFEPLFQDTQSWIRLQVRDLYEGRLVLDFDTREKLLEINNNLNLLELGLKLRSGLEKIPGMKGVINLLNKVNVFSPVTIGYTKAALSLAFRSDPLTALSILADYAAARPIAQAIWRSAIVPWSRHLPFGWDLKQGTYGMEVYWKPAKWVKDKVKEGLFKLAEKTGLKRAGEWIAQKIFKTTFAKLAAAFTGLATGFLIAWGALKKSIKATAGILFLFLISHGLPTALAAAIGGGLTAFFAAGLATTGLVLLGVTSPLWLAVAAVVTFAIVLPLAALFWGFMYLKSIGLLSSLASWLASLPAWASQLLPALSTVAFPALAPWLVPVVTGGLIFYQIYQTNLRNTALMAPALGGPITGDHTGILPPGYVGPDIPAYLAVGNCPMTDLHSVGTGSYDPLADTGHGSTSYGTHSYSIPIQTIAGADCTQYNPLICPMYGYAADIYPTDKNSYPAVALPKICLENSPSCNDLTWVVNGFWFNCKGTGTSSPSQCTGDHWGWGVVLSASGNGNNWKIYLNHLDLISGLTIGQKFTSGQTIGAITRDLGPPSHLHLELNVNGFAQKPDFLCQ